MNDDADDNGQILVELRGVREDAAGLGERVEKLIEAMQTSQKQFDRLRLLGVVVAMVSVLALVIGGFSAYLYTEVLDANEQTSALVAQNQENAVVSCQNANESRRAQSELWTFIIEVSLAGGEESPSERAFLNDLLDWINALFEQRDCADLTRHYELPPPPTIPDLG